MADISTFSNAVNQLGPGGSIVAPATLTLTTTATSGTKTGLTFQGTASDGGVNSTTVVKYEIFNPTINYTAASKTGKVYLVYMNPVLTSLPTGNNGGLIFSSTLNASTFPAVIFNNQTDEDTNFENVTMGYVSNAFQISSAKGGTGTARGINIQVSGSTWVSIGASGLVTLGASSGSSSSFALTTMQGSLSGTSGTRQSCMIQGTYSDGGTNSTTVIYSLQVSPTVNYTAATKTGKVYLAYFNPTLTAIPTGQNAGLTFSSAFNVVANNMEAIRFMNTSDEDTNYEHFEMGWHVAANVFSMRAMNGGTGTARDVALNYAATTAQAILIKAGGAGVPVSNGHLQFGVRTWAVLSGTDATSSFFATYQDGGTTSSATQYMISLVPAINYTAASKTGSFYAIYVNPTLTSQPTGNSGGIVFSSTASSFTGGTALVFNNQADEQTNYEAFRFGFVSNVFTIAGQKGGTGTSRNFAVSLAGTTVMTLTSGGGMQVGAAPTGGDKGVGTINVSVNIFLNGTAYTNPDYVLEQWVTGGIKKFAANKGAKGYKRRSLEEMEAYVREHLRLPGIDDNPMGVVERFDTLLEKVEEIYTHLFEMKKLMAA